mmetsp:Transcript_20867/g.70044  ORF Transcript_20867/g.70044 Transcript_20867/m.70044 type:complete len:386 (+) Transcript_20867:64-1221(+)
MAWAPCICQSHTSCMRPHSPDRNPHPSTIAQSWRGPLIAPLRVAARGAGRWPSRLVVHLVIVRAVELVDGGLDHLRVLGVEVQRRGHAHEGLLGLPHALVHLAQEHVHGALPRGELPQREKLLEGLLAVVEGQEHAGPLEPRERVVPVELERARQLAERLVRGPPSVEGLLVERHAQVAVEGRGGGVDGEGLPQVVHRQVVLLLPVVDVPEAVPRVVVPRVQEHGLPVAGHGLVEVLVGGVLVATERVRIRQGRVQLDGPLQELEGVGVLLLQGEGVAQDGPRVRAPTVVLHGVVSESAEGHLLAQVPQERRVVLVPFQAVRLHAEGHVEGELRLGVLDHLKVGPSHLAEHPPRAVLLLGEPVEELQGLGALVGAHEVERLRERA